MRSPAWRTTRTTRPTRSTRYGAHFAEVGVDADTAEIRLRRMLGVFSAGRILNPKTARSQMIGGMTLGVSYALARRGDRGYAVRRLRQPGSRGIPGAGARRHTRDRRRHSSTGSTTRPTFLASRASVSWAFAAPAAAVTNAVFNATGVRVRDFPITLDKVLGRLPRPNGSPSSAAK